MPALEDSFDSLDLFELSDPTVVFAALEHAPTILWGTILYAPTILWALQLILEGVKGEFYDATDLLSPATLGRAHRPSETCVVMVRWVISHHPKAYRANNRLPGGPYNNLFAGAPTLPYYLKGKGKGRRRPSGVD